MIVQLKAHVLLKVKISILYLFTKILWHTQDERDQQPELRIHLFFQSVLSKQREKQQKGGGSLFLSELQPVNLRQAAYKFQVPTCLDKYLYKHTGVRGVCVCAYARGWVRDVIVGRQRVEPILPQARGREERGEVTCLWRWDLDLGLCITLSPMLFHYTTLPPRQQPYKITSSTTEKILTAGFLRVWKV